MGNLLSNYTNYNNYTNYTNYTNYLNNNKYQYEKINILTKYNTDGFSYNLKMKKINQIYIPTLPTIYE